MRVSSLGSGVILRPVTVVRVEPRPGFVARGDAHGHGLIFFTKGVGGLTPGSTCARPR